MSYTASNIPAEKHFFFDRHGGVSSGKYASLNASIKSQDNRENIFQNLRLAAEHYNQPVQNLAILVQGVSNKAVYVEKPSQYETTADGMVTDKPNIILALRTADCAPVLFWDKRNHVIGASHAGWRGALRGIMENTLDIMLHRGANKNDICAAVGPCLQRHSFVCQQDMLKEFVNVHSEYRQFFTACPEGFLFDAERFIVQRLKLYGIKNITASGINTYTDENYFSYRRNCHRNLIPVPLDFPTHLSTITL